MRSFIIYTLYIIRMIKPRRMRWTVMQHALERRTYKILVEKPEEKRLL
jgi:hypothetical protein